MLAIETESLSKRFGRRRAVEDVSLAVSAGEVFGFLGPNGAGKTTTLRLLLGLLRPDTGRVRLLGRDVARDRVSAVREVGAMIGTPAFYDHLTGRDHLALTCRVLELPPREADRAFEAVGLEDGVDHKVRTYSSGMRQRLGLARALLGSPRLLLLDEPTNGLDPEGIQAMRTLIRELPAATGATVFMSSHLLGEVEQAATSVAFMRSGRLVLQGDLDALRRRQAKALVFEVDDPAQAAEVLARAGVVVSGVEGSQVRTVLSDRDTVIDTALVLNRTLVQAGVGVSRLVRHGSDLEEVYAAAMEGAT